MELNRQLWSQERREPDPQDVEFRKLLKPLAEEYGEKDILKYVADTTDIALDVISRWFKNDSNRPTNPVLRRRILVALTNFREGDLPKPSLYLVKTKKPTAITAPEPSPEKVKAKPKSLNKKVVAERRSGERDVLPTYESDLYDYLKNTFSYREFHLGQIRFSLKKVGGRRYMYRNLDFLKKKGYIEGPFRKDGSNLFYYKVIIE